METDCNLKKLGQRFHVAAFKGVLEKSRKTSYDLLFLRKFTSVDIFLFVLYEQVLQRHASAPSVTLGGSPGEVHFFKYTTCS